MQLAQSLGSGRGRLRRRVVAVAAARATASASRLVGRDGTALPGLVALRIDDTLLGSLAGQLRHVVVVVGANGKTTTTRLTARIVERATGVRPVSNRSGANLVQ